MASMLLSVNGAMIALFGIAIVVILFHWLVMTEDRHRFKDYVGNGSLWAWIAFSGGMYFGEGYGMGDAIGGGFGGAFGADVAGCGGCGGGGV